MVTEIFEYLAALHIYISILEQQGKYETALEVISGNLGSLIGIEVDKLRIQVILDSNLHYLIINS